MPIPVIATKLLIPPLRPHGLPRSRLVSRLDAGSEHRLRLIAAPAGFGKTTLLSAWIAERAPPAAWLALDAGDSDPHRFLAHLIAALQTLVPSFGAGVAAALQAPQPPPADTLIPALLNGLAALPQPCVLVLDDYHLVDAPAADRILAALLDQPSPQLRLVLATRADPNLPLARLRARGQLSELRAADLRCTADEAADFLRRVMGLELTAHDVAALEARTEGWIAGLQLAALSLQGHADAAGFIAAFSGSHRFVLDYLLEEVLHRLPEATMSFLLQSAILERLCGPLCDALLQAPTGVGQATLEQLDRANLFLVPLDHERRWFRYHHLFADLLRQRLGQHPLLSAQLAALHGRAAGWYEANGLLLDGFAHAVAAADQDRAERLIAGKGMPLLLQGAAAPVLRWLETLSAAELRARPSLLVTYASALLATGQNTRVEPALQTAEEVLREHSPDAALRDLIGQIAALRARLAAPTYDAATIIAHSQRALEHLRPDNLPARTTATRTLAIAYKFQGERMKAAETYAEAIALCEASGNRFENIVATTGLGIVEELDIQLDRAAGRYRRALELASDSLLPLTCEAELGLGRLGYEWDDLEAARQHGRRCIELARHIETIDSAVTAEILLARVQLAAGDPAGAAARLERVEREARRQGFAATLPEVAAAQARALLAQAQPGAAAALLQPYDLPLSQARLQLALGEPDRALAQIERALRAAEARGWHDERLRALILQALALYQRGDVDRALRALAAALALAAPGRFVRSFLDEGAPMAELLTRMQEAGGGMQGYLGALIAGFEARPEQPADRRPSALSPQPLAEPLSERELEVLRLVSQGLSNRQIGERLILALDTVKGHNRRIYEKLQVGRRTEAVARARELGLL